MIPPHTHTKGRPGRHAALTLLGGLLATLSAATPALAQSRPAEDTRHPYIVVYERGLGSVDSKVGAQERAEGFRARHRYRHAIKGFAARLSEAQVKRLGADPDVVSVSRDRPLHADGSVPLAAGEPLPPTGVRRMLAATDSNTREASVAGVAVLDTGIDLQHPDLNVGGEGVDCVTPGTSAQDDNGHGTHVAGTVAARNNGSGVVGISPNTAVYAVKVLDDQGAGFDSDAICGLDWVTANSQRLNLKVANMSFGGQEPLGERDDGCGTSNVDALHRAVCGATTAGVTLVAATGNDAKDVGGDVLLGPVTPATYPEVLTVSAMSDSDGRSGGLGPPPGCRGGEQDDAAATFSNYATSPQDSAHMIAAPGVCIRSTWLAGGYSTKSGTSMASPHVAGAVALCLGEGGVAGLCAGMSPAEIIRHLRKDAADYTGGNPGYGFVGDPLRPDGSRYFGYLVRATPPTTTPGTAGTPATTSTTPGTTAAAPPSATAAPPSGSLPSTTSGTTPVTAARIGALLESDLTPAGRALRRLGIATLVRRRGFTARGLGALTAGRFSATLTASSGRAGVARRIILARGSRSVSRGGRYDVLLRLTREGRRLLRRDRRAQVTLVLGFRDAFGHAATRRKSVTLRR